MNAFKPLAAVFASFPLTDRITLYHDSRAAVLAGLFTGLALPLVSVVGRRLGMNSGQFALMNMTMYVGAILNLWFGHIAERGNRAALVFWPGFVSRAVVFFAAFVSGPVSFMLIFSIYYFVSVLSVPAYSSIMRSNYSEANRSLLMGNIRILMQLTSALVAALAGWYVQGHPAAYRLIFPLAALFGMAGSLAFSRIRPRGDHRPEAKPAGRVMPRAVSFRAAYANVLSDKVFLAYMGIFFLIGFPGKVIIPVEPIRLVDELGMDYASAGLIQGTVPFVAGILSYLFFSRAIARVDPFALLLLSVALMAVRYLGIALSTQAVQLIPWMFIASLGTAGWDMLPLFTIARFSGPRHTALYMGVHTFLVGVRGLLGPLLGTLLYEVAGLSLVPMYWMVFGLELAGFVALAWFIKHYGPGARAWTP
jgi:hypothetical protein